MWVLLPISKVATTSTKRTAAMKYLGFVCICFTETQRLVQYMYHAGFSFAGLRTLRTQLCRIHLEMLAMPPGEPWAVLEFAGGKLVHLNLPVLARMACRSKTGTGARCRLIAWKSLFWCRHVTPICSTTHLVALMLLVEQALIPPAKHYAVCTVI